MKDHERTNEHGGQAPFWVAVIEEMIDPAVNPVTRVGDTRIKLDGSPNRSVGNVHRGEFSIFLSLSFSFADER